MVDSVLPIFESDSDGYESSNSHDLTREVLMVNSGSGKGAEDDDVDDVLATPITDKTPEAQKLEVAILSLATEKERLK